MYYTRPNLVPRVLSYPLRRAGRRGNEVAEDPHIVRKGTLSVTKSLRFDNIKQGIAVIKKT